jgi:hypothetical protein
VRDGRLPGMTKTSPVAIAVTAIATLAIGVPVSGAATLKGTTKDGNRITLKRSGNKVSKIKTMVSTICTETTGSGYTRAGGELFEPPGSFTLGSEQKTKALQPAAMNHGNDATKNYTVKVRKSGRGVRGKLSVNFSFLIPDLYRSMPYIYLCQGTSTFTAK